MDRYLQFIILTPLIVLFNYWIRLWLAHVIVLIKFSNSLDRRKTEPGPVSGLQKPRFEVSGSVPG